ncbi:hypothetical protein Abr02nite_50320 [Paractinoplanes brasiliensis]|nr:hypothetical protein Abr02nite_50320 [Actinoplanes brasiliensis]
MGSPARAGFDPLGGGVTRARAITDRLSCPTSPRAPGRTAADPVEAPTAAVPDGRAEEAVPAADEVPVADPDVGDGGSDPGLEATTGAAGAAETGVEATTVGLTTLAPASSGVLLP